VSLKTCSAIMALSDGHHVALAQLESVPIKWRFAALVRRCRPRLTAPPAKVISGRLGQCPHNAQNRAKVGLIGLVHFQQRNFLPAGLVDGLVDVVLHCATEGTNVGKRVPQQLVITIVLGHALLSAVPNV